MTTTDECRAKRWKAEPCYDGPHQPHFFYYGPPGQYEGHMYMGSCAGVSEGETND